MTIHVGDVRDVLPTIKAGSVQCVATSPPYWGLRDYGVEGQIGLEPTLDAYVETMVGVFREVRRVLADDGVCWLNLGDMYATGAGRVGECPGGGIQGEKWKSYGPASKQVQDRKAMRAGIPTIQPNRMPQRGLKPKDLCLVPARVALALQADGWYVRSEIIWCKGVSFRPEWSGSVMPESVKDRPTRAHETVWLLTKSERYFYDAEAVREAWADDRNGAAGGTRHERAERLSGPRRRPNAAPVASGRNLRDVWAINPKPFPGAHFATFPQALVEPMIKAGSHKGDTVLDPFAGSGTTGIVAKRLGREFIGIELSQEYAQMAREQIDGPLFAEAT